MAATKDYTIGHLYIDGKYCCDTIEDRILALQESKSDLAERFVGAGGGASSLAALRREDLQRLLED